MDGLRHYFRESSKEEIAKLSEKIGFIAIANFTINEDGKPETIEIAALEEYKSVEQAIRNVIDNIPQWMDSCQRRKCCKAKV